MLQVWEASDKREYAARTIRPKIHKQLGTFLEDFPDLPDMPAWDEDAPKIDWDKHISDATERGALHAVCCPRAFVSEFTWHSSCIHPISDSILVVGDRYLAQACCSPQSTAPLVLQSSSVCMTVRWLCAISLHDNAMPRQF